MDRWWGIDGWMDGWMNEFIENWMVDQCGKKI
jgi:hypothetical protein